MESKSNYVVLAECNGKHYETWYTFIKYEGNENALSHLHRQLEKVDFYILDDLSTFDLDMDNKVSAQTAKEMSKVEVNSILFHRKFDGTLGVIDLGFRSKDSNDKKIVKTFDKLGVGKIEDFIDGEDVDPDDLKQDLSDDGEGDESNTESDDDYNYNISESEEEPSSSEDDRKLSKKEIQRRRLVQKLKGLGRK